ncbi:MAG: O-antigen ligase family protein [Ignavibacteriaceae bacterium]
MLYRILIKNRKQIIEFILANIFLLNISVAAISNYSLNIFIIKMVSSAALLIIIVVDVKLNKFDIPGIVKMNNPKKMFMIIGFFIGYLGITLIYSDNPAYGAQKILNFISSTLPSVAAFYYLIVTVSKERFNVFIIALVIITLLTVSYIFIVYPFDPGTTYEYRAGRWSHVIFGRMIGSIAIVFLLYMSSRSNLKQILLYSVITSIAVYGLYLSSLRSAFLGLMLVALCLSIFLILKSVFLVRSSETKGQGSLSGVLSSMERKKQLSGLILTTIITLLLIIVIPKPEIIETRFDNLTQIEDLEFGADEPINTRIEALKISKKIFLEHPLFGVGFGGFRSYNEFTELVKYPHNIFVEMAVEGGVVGLLVLCALCFIMFKSSYRFSPSSFIFLLFALFLAMFSKELSNQSLLWIGLAFYGVKRD